MNTDKIQDMENNIYILEDKIKDYIDNNQKAFNRMVNPSKQDHKRLLLENDLSEDTIEELAKVEHFFNGSKYPSFFLDCFEGITGTDFEEIDKNNLNDLWVTTRDLLEAIAIQDIQDSVDCFLEYELGVI